jgi:ParB family chromosome partitioning protein
MAGRHTSLATLAGQKVDEVPGKSDSLLLSLPLDKLAPTRFNPRRRFGTEDELREFGAKLVKKQLQPAVVVSRAAYLKLWPEEAEHVGTASYVIANGERRYRASLLVGRTALEVVRKEDVAKSRADFLDAVQSENNDREDLDPIERAIGIDIMVTQLGGADPVAVYYGKTKGWVSQQRKLLKLTPDLQDLVSAGEMPIRVARDIAGLPADVQAKAWEEEVERRRLEKAAAAQIRSQRREQLDPPPPAPAPSRFTAVNSAAPQPALSLVPAPAPSPVPNPDTGGEAARRDSPPSDAGTRPVAETRPAPQDAERDQPGQPTRLPEARTIPAPDGTGPRVLPYDDGFTVARHLILKMPPDALEEAIRILNQHAVENGLNIQTEPTP